MRWSGAVPLRGVREPRDAEEKWQSLDWSLQGVAPSVRPHWWVDYALVVSQVQQRMLPLPALEARLDGQARMRLQSAVQALGTASESLFYLPLVSAYALDDWIMLFDAKANKVGYAPVSGFTQADAAK